MSIGYLNASVRDDDLRISFLGHTDLGLQAARAALAQCVTQDPNTVCDCKISHRIVVPKTGTGMVKHYCLRASVAKILCLLGW
jgi:hypothetical protein